MKYLRASFDYLFALGTPADYRVQSLIPGINNCIARVQKGQRCFEMDIEGLKPYDGMINEPGDGFGLSKSFTLIKDGFQLENPKGVAKLTLELSNLTAKCQLWEINSNLTQSVERFYRLILPCPYNPHRDPYKFIASRAFRTDNGSYAFAGLITINTIIGDIEVYNCNQERSFFLIYDCAKPVKFYDFIKTAEHITSIMGFITGSFHRDELYVLQADTKDFQELTGSFYQRKEDSVLSGMDVVSPELFEIKDVSPPPDSYISENVFSEMVQKSLSDPRFYRSIKIVSEGNAFPLAIRASAYSVALETIKNIIIEDNAEKINPFKTKMYASQIIEQLIEFINKNDDAIFNSKASVIGKLKHLNQVTNKESFKKAFELCGFILNDNDEFALLKRNDFLHGRLPFEDEHAEGKDLEFYTYKMHFLVAVLILKYCGYQGWIKNTPVYLSAIKNLEKQVIEPLFRR